ncbi:hypothetical protein EJB05_42544, partial [Eragrostis curvula]
MRGNGAVCAMIIIFLVVFGCLASPTECRRSQLREARGATRGNQHIVPNTSTNNATAGNVSPDERKLRMLLCARTESCTHRCFCCKYNYGPNCYETKELCRASCGKNFIEAQRFVRSQTVSNGGRSVAIGPACRA